jgi:hypothetical protein
MDKIYVILTKNGLVVDVSDFAYEERAAAISTFKHHYLVQIKQEPDLDERINEIIEEGYIGFGNGFSSIQMVTAIS